MKNEVKLSGGALIEGVMIKNEGQFAMALRKGNSDIEIVHDVYKGILGRGSFSKIPILRGVCALIDCMGLGIKTFLFSSDFYEDNTKEEPGAIARFLKKFTGKYHDSFELIFCITLALILSIGGFMVLPYFITMFLADLVLPNTALMTILETLLRVIMLIVYIVIFLMNKEFKKICRYHGAQHKVLNCLNNGEELTISNVKKAPKYDKNCEINFVFWVFAISCILFALLRSNDVWIRAAIRIIIIPVVAAIMYELIYAVNKASKGAISILHAPFIFIQKLFVAEPSADMIEVAIESLQAVFDWREFLGLPAEDNSEYNYANNMDEVKDRYTDNVSAGYNETQNMQQNSMYDNNYYNNYDNANNYTGMNNYAGYNENSYEYNNINDQVNYNNLSYDDYNNGQYFVESDGAHNPHYTDLGNVITRQSLDEGITKQPEIEQDNYNNMDYGMYNNYMQNDGYANNYNNYNDYNNMGQGMYNQGNYGNGYSEDDDLKMLDRYFTDDNY